MSIATARATGWSVPVKGDGEGRKFEPCPQGNHPGTIVGVLDIGHHEKKRDDGSEYEARELVLVIELTKKDSQGNPFVLGQRMSFVVHKKSTLYSVAVSLTGKTPNEGEHFDPCVLCGLPCLVQVVNKPSKDGKTFYANIDSKGIKAYPEGLPAPVPKYEPFTWSINENTPCPNDPWLPYIYGQRISQLVNESAEAKEALAEEAARFDPHEFNGDVRL